MRIWILTHFFPPEVGAGAIRLDRLARMLAADGHSVTVLTGMPNYPEGRIKPPYQGHVFLHENRNGVEVYRTWVYATPSKGARARLLNQLSLTIMTALRGTFLPRPDVLLVESHPLPIVISGGWLRRIKRVPIILNVSDLWPESAVATGVLRADSSIVRVAERVERWAYRDAAHIVGMTQGVVDGILKVHPFPERVTLLPNAIDLAVFRPGSIEEKQSARRQFGLDDRFWAAHVGNMSLTYNFDTILDAMALIPEIGLIFVGEGSQANHVRDGIAARALTNVRMLGLLPHEQMPTVWHAADACVISLGNHSVADGTRPAKMYEAFATGTPVVAACRGESAVLLETSGGGIAVPLEDSNGMAEALHSLANQPELGRSMRQAGRTFAEQHLAPERVTNTFVKLFSMSSRN